MDQSTSKGCSCLRNLSPYLAAKPDFLGLFSDLYDPHRDFLVSERAYRMIDHDRLKIRHADGATSQLGLPHELSRDDRRRRNAKSFECDGVPDAARAARSAVADCGE